MSAMTATTAEDALARTGIVGLDEILRGGLPRGQVYLIEGVPGAGKTTLALQFVLEGVKCGERTLYVTLSETCEDLRSTAMTHGWSFDGVECVEILLSGELGDQEAGPMMYHPSETELGDTLRAIKEAIERVKPDRIVVDSLTEIRLQAQTPLRYRREVLALRQFLKQSSCTAILLDELREEMTAQSVVYGILEMQRETPPFGPAKRRLQIAKLRGVDFWDGHHDYVIRPGGIQLFPRLVAAEHRQKTARRLVTSGLAELDALLGGGLPAGSTTLLAGPAGSGKSSTASQLVLHALEQGDQAVIYTFDETKESYLLRAAGLGMKLEPFADRGSLMIQQVDPGELSPGHFTHLVRQAVEVQHASVLVIDSLNGYLNSMPNEQFLIVQLHELATYLNQKGVFTLLVLSQTGLVGVTENPLDVSYLADNVVLFRHFEAGGEVRHAVSVLKKRTGAHERSIRELELTSEGVRLGEPLREFQGVLTGVPQFIGRRQDLLEQGKQE
jgi:circadian clock protein KaiC